MNSINITLNTNGLCTPWQEQTLLLCAHGKHVRGAAKVMGITENTAYAHAEQACERLGGETLAHSISLCWLQGYMRRISGFVLCWSLLTASNLLAPTPTQAGEDDPYRINRTSRARGTRRATRNGWRSQNNRTNGRETKTTLPWDEMDIEQLLQENTR